MTEHLMRQRDWLRGLGRPGHGLDDKTRLVAYAMGATARVDGTHASLSAKAAGLAVARGERMGAEYLKTLQLDGWIEQTERGGLRGKKAHASVYSLTRPNLQRQAHLLQVGNGSQPATPQAPTCNEDARSLQTPVLNRTREGDVRRALALPATRATPTKAEIEGEWWPQTADAGREYVVRWVEGYSYLTSIPKAAAWLAERLPSSVNVDDTGWPGAPNDRARRLLWLANILAGEKGDIVPEWNDPSLLSRALDAGMKVGMTMDEAAALLIVMQWELGQHPPSYLTRLASTKEQRTNPAARVCLRHSREELDKWRQQARDLAAAKAATDAADAA